MVVNSRIEAVVRSPVRFRVARSALDILVTWAIIVAAVCLAESFQFYSLYVFVVFVIGTRQHAILSLMHDAAHGHLLGHPRLDEVISDTFCALPLFIATRYYRRFHLQHHAYLNSERDPDWTSKKFPQWKFPKGSNWQLFVFFVCSSYAESTRNRIRRQISMLNPKGQDSRFYARLAITYLIYAGFIHLVVGWRIFALYWLVPAFFVLPFLATVRSVAEHYGLGYRHDLDQSRDVICSWVERQCFSPFGLNYHLTHHLFPEVPRYRLSRLHSELMQVPEFAENAKRNESYCFANSVRIDLLRSS